MARSKRDGTRVQPTGGDDFPLEPADDFDREVALLGQSERFLSFLRERSKESGGRPLADIRKKH